MVEIDLAEQRRQAHLLVDWLPEQKLMAVRGLLETMVEPMTLAQSLAMAPVEEAQRDQAPHGAWRICLARRDIARVRVVANGPAGSGRLSIQSSTTARSDLKAIDRQAARGVLHCIDRYLINRSGDVKHSGRPYRIFACDVVTTGCSFSIWKRTRSR